MFATPPPIIQFFDHGRELLNAIIDQEIVYPDNSDAPSTLDNELEDFEESDTKDIKFFLVFCLFFLRQLVIFLASK